MYRVYFICANLDWNASCEQRSPILTFKSNIDFQYFVEYFAAKRRENVNKAFLFSLTKTEFRREISRRFMAIFRPLKREISTKYRSFRREKTPYVRGEKRRKQQQTNAFFFTLTVHRICKVSDANKKNSTGKNRKCSNAS